LARKFISSFNDGCGVSITVEPFLLALENIVHCREPWPSSEFGERARKRKKGQDPEGSRSLKEIVRNVV
jgi:hypothetical protein